MVVHSYKQTWVISKYILLPLLLFLFYTDQLYTNQYVIKFFLGLLGFHSNHTCPNSPKMYWTNSETNSPNPQKTSTHPESLFLVLLKWKQAFKMKTQVTLGNVNDCFMFVNYSPLTFGRIFIFQCMLFISEFSLDILPKNPYFCFEMKGNVVFIWSAYDTFALGGWGLISKEFPKVDYGLASFCQTKI